MKRIYKSLTIILTSVLLLGCSNNNNSPSSNGDGDPSITPPITHVKELKDIVITSYPNKREYTVGDYIDLTGLKVYAEYTDSYYQDKDVTNDLTIRPTTLSEVGDDIKVYLSYTESKISKSTYFTVKVNEKETPPTPPATVKVTGINCDVSSITLDVNDTYQLTYEVLPDNASDKSVSFSSSSAVVSVTDTGLIIARKDGGCTVTIRTTDGGYTSIVNVTVNKKETPPDDDQGQELPEISYVKVLVEKGQYQKIYAWLDTNPVTKLLGDWPGVALNSYDDNWDTYDFIGYTSLNYIFNGSNGQTADLSANGAGYYWYKNGVNVKSNKEPGEVDLDIPQGNYEIVETASDYLELPAVKNYNKGQVISPYTGSRTDFRDEAIYFAMTTRFYDGDPSNNIETWGNKHNESDDPSWRGDFKGLVEKMDYIKALGFTAIWITPVVKNCSDYDYHGYHAINMKEVDPRLTSEDVAFLDVIKEAHKRDMKIVLDVVFNHTSNNGEENLFPMFNYDPVSQTLTYNEESNLLPANYDSLNPSDQFQARIRAMKVNGDKYNIYHHEMSMGYEQFIEQTGSMAGDCIDLNTENPTVANYLVEAYGEFIRLGVDAFRVDTTKHISRLTLNKYIWPGLYEIAKKCGNNNFHMFGEVCTRVRGIWNHEIQADSCPFYTWAETDEYAWGDRVTNEASTLQHWNDHVNPSNALSINNEYLESGYKYHTPDHSKSSRQSVIDFPMHWNFQYARDAYRVATENDRYYNDATYNVVYVDSHDYGPDGIEKTRYNMGTSSWKENISLMFTFRGVPCIYYGSEIEFQKGKTIDEGPNLALKDSGRAYFGDNIKGSVTPTGFGSYTNANGAISSTLSYTLAKHIEQMARIRLAIPALRRGQYTSCGEMSFVRRYTQGNTDSLAVVSISNGCTFTGLPNGTYVDVISGRTYTVSNGALTTSLSNQGDVAVYVYQNSTHPNLGKI